MNRAATWAALLLAPVAGLALLLSVPSLDVHWEHQPAHFWLVLITGIVTGGLAFLTGEAAARRGDSRVLRLSIAFVCTSGFLGLHALATPGVLLAGKNAGFQAASAIGLLLASPAAAWSALDLGERSGAVLGRRGLLYAALGLANLVLFAGLSEQTSVGLCAFGGALRCPTPPTRSVQDLIGGFQEALVFSRETRHEGTRLYASIADIVRRPPVDRGLIGRAAGARSRSRMVRGRVRRVRVRVRLCWRAVLVARGDAWIPRGAVRWRAGVVR